MTCVLAKLPAELWRTKNDGFAAIAEAIDALAVQVDCARYSFHLEPANATRTAELARACTQPANQVLAAAVAGGTLTSAQGGHGAAPARPGRTRPSARQT